MSTSTTAQHAARCPECDTAIRVGDRIVRANSFDVWRHAACPPTKFDFDPDTVCPVCFTVRATTGACNCA